MSCIGFRIQAYLPGLLPVGFSIKAQLREYSAELCLEKDVGMLC